MTRILWGGIVYLPWNFYIFTALSSCLSNRIIYYCLFKFIKIFSVHFLKNEENFIYISFCQCLKLLECGKRTKSKCLQKKCFQNFLRRNKWRKLIPLFLIMKAFFIQDLFLKYDIFNLWAIQWFFFLLLIVINYVNEWYQLPQHQSFFEVVMGRIFFLVRSGMQEHRSHLRP